MTISQFEIKYFVCKQASIKMFQVLSSNGLPEVKEEPQLGFNTEKYKTENKRFL